ncbi:MAG TPA: aspartyl-phosphate phosphatase Spo0E family protein [Clostridia bacterium]|nr:aspartyl-phosphate phosphatase Spo0E family protein [Clostridia bacterium]
MFLFVLRLRIEHLRAKLNKTERTGSAPGAKVLALSKKLDGLIVVYQSRLLQRCGPRSRWIA